MSGINYKLWANYIYQISCRYINPGESSVIELAAGNGNLSKHLSKKFASYLASDNSISMLKNFKAKKIDRVCFDMIYPSVNKQFDLIICSFDSINYILSKQKLKTFFRNISGLLNTDGIFLFDAGLIRNSLHHQKYAVKNGRIKNISFKRKSIYLQKSRIHKNIFEFYFQDGTKIKEVHRQKIFELKELFNIIDQCNLFVVECFKAFTFKDCKAHNFRAQFVVKRKNRC